MNTSAAAFVVPQLEDSRLILSAFSPGTRRQLELTVNALSRAIRKAIRAAEKLAAEPTATPAEKAAAWQQVEDRCGTMRDFVRALVIQPVSVPAIFPEVEPESLPLAENAAEPQVQPQTLSQPVARPEPEAAEPATMDTEFDSAANARPGDSHEEDGDDHSIVSHCIERIRHIDNLPEVCRQQRRRNEREIETLLSRIEKRAPDIAANIRRSRGIMRTAA